MTILSRSKLNIVRDNAFNFLKKITADFSVYKFTENSEESAFACCFSFFIINLLKQKPLDDSSTERALKFIIFYIDRHYHEANKDELAYNKSYMQLTCFFISVLKITGHINLINLSKYIEPIIKIDPINYLSKVGALNGTPGSGNFAMFYMIMNIYAKNELCIDTAKVIDTVVDLHMSHRNRFGLWGNSNSLTYAMFQNNYHQYEIFEYLGIHIDKQMSINLVNQLSSLCDQYGHFAPYPGGGGCYDYDAIHLLTYPYLDDDIFQKEVARYFITIFNGLLMCQNPDGGFCESKMIRPRSPYQLMHTIKHIFKSPNRTIFIERFRKNIVLQRPRHSRIHTHWTKYSRAWSESNLWDTWFRLLAIARIDVFLDKNKFSEWGFVDHPGIGYHHLFKNG